MRITMREDVAKAVRKKAKGSPGQFVNDILSVYLKGGFISKSQIAGTVNAKKVIRKNIEIAQQEYDMISGVFKGITVDGEEPSDSLFIADANLFELLKNNTMVVVLKSPRKQDIEKEPSDRMFIRVAKQDMS